MTLVDRIAPLRAASVGLVLGSGALLVLAGSLGEAREWAFAALAATAAAIATSVAFVLRARTEPRGTYVGSRRNASPDGRDRRGVVIGAVGLRLTSAGIMFAAGYLGSSVSWHVAGVLAFVGGPVIAAAYRLDRYARSS
jgi:hypothetical protein